MALSTLPNELLDSIIEHSLTSGFENLAMTCKRVYAGCKPFIQRHNELRWYEKFQYHAYPGDSVVAASDLISIIAADPVVARYIRTANLVSDSWSLQREGPYNRRRSVPGVEDGAPIVQLFANSTYLRRAGLDWKEYYSTFANDVREQRYSQHGSAFLLTLLSNLEHLTIPESWKPNDATNQLLDILVKESTKQPSFQCSSRLRSITIDASMLSSRPEEWAMSLASPFLALPHLKLFNGSGGFAVGEDHQSLAFEGSPHIAANLEAAHLSGCIDDVGITDFLKHTPRLKTLTYSHSTQHEHRSRGWNICKFVNAVAREAGGHLIAFSITVPASEGSIIPGKVSTRSFQRLEKFKFPLKLVTCNINAAGVTGNIASSLQRLFSASSNPFLRDLVPPSVMELSIESEGLGPYDKRLDALFSQFGATRKSHLPLLQDVYISLQQEADSNYKQQCMRIVRECRIEGVQVHLV